MTDAEYRQQAYKIIVYKQIDLLTKILKNYGIQKQVSEIQEKVQSVFSETRKRTENS